MTKIVPPPSLSLHSIGCGCEDLRGDVTLRDDLQMLELVTHPLVLHEDEGEVHKGADDAQLKEELNHTANQELAL